MRSTRSLLRSATRGGAGLVLGALLLAARVAAAQDVPVARPGNEATLSDNAAVNVAMSQPQPLPAPQEATDGDLGEHQMTGTVRSADQRSGTVLIDFGGKEVTGQFPASARSRVAAGDRVTVPVQKLNVAER